MSAATGPRAGVPARTIPVPTTQHGEGDERDAQRRPWSHPPSTRVAYAAEVVRRRPGFRREPIEQRPRGADEDEAAEQPTFVPHSSTWGAIRSVLITATSRPNATRPTVPVGTVLGSVIMKNRKIMTSGENTTTRQKSKPQTGANAQFAVMQWPDPPRTPDPDREGEPERRRQARAVEGAG